MNQESSESVTVNPNPEEFDTLDSEGDTHWYPDSECHVSNFDSDTESSGSDSDFYDPDHEEYLPSRRTARNSKDFIL